MFEVTINRDQPIALILHYDNENHGIFSICISSHAFLNTFDTDY